jgi:hypothetical protein
MYLHILEFLLFTATGMKMKGHTNVLTLYRKYKPYLKF